MHNLDMTGNRANIAFTGSRNDIWHRMGQEMVPGMSIADWAKAAGLDWEAVKVPAIAALEGDRFNHVDAAKRFAPVHNHQFIVRSDTGAALGIASNVYKPHQPAEVLAWFEQYISVDDRFALDVAGSLRGGAQIWATATYKDPLAVAGEKHAARILMTTTFDGSGSTINQATMTRVVCNNTLDVATADKRAVVRTRHNTNFDPARVGRELAQIAQGFAVYKQVGDALARCEMARDQVVDFFNDCLDIPRDAKPDDISGRKRNQISDLKTAYRKSVTEGAEAGSAWAALQAITRYVDHDRGSDDVARFASAQFGSGSDLKAKAMGLLMPRIADKVTA